MKKEDVSPSDQQTVDAWIETQWKRIPDKAGFEGLAKFRQGYWKSYLSKSDQEFKNLVASVRQKQAVEALSKSDQEFKNFVETIRQQQAVDPAYRHGR